MFKTVKQQITLVGASLVLAAFSLASIINFSDPFAASWVTHLFFYISLFLFILALFTLIGLGIRQWLSPKLYILNLSASFRQGMLIALLLVISFLLLSERMLFWWVELALLLFFLFVELFLNLKI